MDKKDKTIVVGMSGGVDSSVAALLLKKQGYNVIGMFMKNWEEEDSRGNCLSTKDYEDVMRVCETLDIPYYTVNFAKEYKEKVFNNFLEEYQKGLTPNPDILCNKEIKFNLLLDKAKKLGADFLATGHYAKIIHSDKCHLAKAFDDSKDQSYFLYTLTSDILKEVLFPLSDISKKEVRTIAKEYNLSTHDKKDSTGICFIGERNFRPFLGKFLGFQEGDIETVDGKKIGRHLGTSFYTLGQRKGLCIGGEGDAWFVSGKDMKKNMLIVAQGKDHPALFCDELIANNLTWVTKPPLNFPFSCRAKIRYRQIDQQCSITKIEEGKALVTFESPQRAATPSQSIVFYDNDICLGGGIIQTIGLSYYHQNKTLPI
jgi:tRNA-uridine 2-sulfurtransferase